MLIINKTRHWVWWLSKEHNKILKMPPLHPIELNKIYIRKTKTTLYRTNYDSLPPIIPGIKYIVSSCVAKVHSEREDFLIFGSDYFKYNQKYNIIAVTNFKEL